MISRSMINKKNNLDELENIADCLSFRPLLILYSTGESKAIPKSAYSSGIRRMLTIIIIEYLYDVFFQKVIT